MWIRLASPQLLVHNPIFGSNAATVSSLRTYLLYQQVHTEGENELQEDPASLQATYMAIEHAIRNQAWKVVLG